MVALPRTPTSSDRVVSRFAGLLHESSSGSARLQRGVELAVTLVPWLDHASVTVLTPHYVETAAASDEVARRGDSWQHELSEGPGLDSVRTRTAAPGAVGSLNLYADRVLAWDVGQQRLARALGDQLAVAVAEARLTDAGAREALARAGLGQAQGIVMERFRMTPEQAFTHLERLAQVRQVPLVHLAERIVSTRELPVLGSEKILHP
jgi:hypothetical protein